MTSTARANHKDAVLLAFPGEGHGLPGLANRRDLTVRYFEFFDHFHAGENNLGGAAAAP